MNRYEMQIVVTETLRQLGLTDGEISDRQARRVYGKPFIEAVEGGLIKPVRVGNGRTGTRYYRVIDILSWKAESYEPAHLVYKNR